MLNLLSLIVFCLFSFVASYWLTGLIRHYALNNSLLDIPNARSSHHFATPRGGGLAFVIVFLSILGGLSLWGSLTINPAHFVALILSGAWVAGIGFWDDHQSISAKWRFMVHLAAAIWGLYWLGGFPPIIFFGNIVDLGWVGHTLGLFYLVWLLNLYNFMDGIDGIAGIEAITVCLGAALLNILGAETEQWRELLLLACTVTGFLCWNFAPARIFMGDAGSGFLGIVLGLFSIEAAWSAPQFFWSWLILLGVFIVDASCTLWRRYCRGEKVYEAHRSHAYQNAARFYHAHEPVSLTVGAINIGWLIPLALWVGIGGLDGFWGVIIAYIPLVLLALHFKAGVGNIH